MLTLALSLGTIVGALPAARITAPEEEPLPISDAYTPLGVNDRGMAVFARPRDRARVVWIPAGTFEQNAYFPRATDEPESEFVHVPAFGIDETEVTNRQFTVFLNSIDKDVDEKGRPLAIEIESGMRKEGTSWRSQPGCGELPAIGVTGYGALAYARWVGGDLPRLSEWQKAASGTDGAIFPWGSDAPGAVHANYRRFGPDMPMPVGSYPAGRSVYGLFDMAGNVYERVYSRRGGVDMPTMIRGGSWASPSPLNLRTFDLCMQGMETADRTVGFRCVVRSGKGLPSATVPEETLRMARSWRDALAEARERNVPLLLSLQYDTCGQCDRLKVGLFRDPEFIRVVNADAVLALGQVPWDAGDDPHREGADGRCTLYPDLACHEHIDLFYEGLKRVEGFRISPGNFVLDPRVDDDVRDAAQWILIGEDEFPKGGVGAERFLAKLAEAQKELGEPVSREEWLSRR